MSHLQLADFITLLLGLVICATTAAIVALLLFVQPVHSSMSAPTPSEVVRKGTMDSHTRDPSCLSTTP